MPPSTPHLLERMSRLSDPVRARLLRALQGRELSVGELCTVVQLPQPSVSRHLKALLSGHLVRTRRDGTSNLYRAEAPYTGDEKKLWNLVLKAMETYARDDDERLQWVLAERKKRSEQFFSTHAEFWDKVREDFFGRSWDLRALPALLDERWTIGDLGCGTGVIAAQLAPFVHKVIGVDDNTDMLAVARRRVEGLRQVEFRQGVLRNLPIADATLDAAIVALVLAHVGDPITALKETARALKPGGRLLVVEMPPPQPREPVPFKLALWNGFRPELVADFAREAGFERVRARPLARAPSARGPALFTVTGVRAAAPASNLKS